MDDCIHIYSKRIHIAVHLDHTDWTYFQFFSHVLIKIVLKGENSYVNLKKFCIIIVLQINSFFFSSAAARRQYEFLKEQTKAELRQTLDQILEGDEKVIVLKFCSVAGIKYHILPTEPKGSSWLASSLGWAPVSEN